MDKKLIVIFSLIAIILISFVIMFIFKSNELITSPTKLEECKTIVYNGDEKTNIVFLSPKETAEVYSSYLINSPPFNEYKNSFNFYYIDSFSPTCELYKDIAVFCYNNENIKKSSSCPNDIIIATETHPPNIRSSAYMNVISINTALPKSVLLHEFGHVFANLADEYIPSQIPKGSKNCQGNCEGFNREVDGCFQGCSDSSKMRSIENGIMRTLSSSSFGKFDTSLIIERINKKNLGITGKIVGDNIADCSNQRYILIDAKLLSNQIDIISKTTEYGCVGASGAGGYNYNLVMKDDSVFSSGEFNPELIFTDDLNGGEVKTSDRSFLLKIPIIANSKRLEILENGQKISEINLLDTDARPCKV